jgi:hypothetical protein
MDKNTGMYSAASEVTDLALIDYSVFVRQTKKIEDSAAVHMLCYLLIPRSLWIRGEHSYGVCRTQENIQAN